MEEERERNGTGLLGDAAVTVLQMSAPKLGEAKGPVQAHPPLAFCLWHPCPPSSTPAWLNEAC